MRAEDFMVDEKWTARFRTHDEIRSHGAIGNLQGRHVRNAAFRDARDKLAGDNSELLKASQRVDIASDL